MEFETTTAKRAGGVSRMDHTHVTVPTCFVERDGIRFTYRRLGQESGIPLPTLNSYTLSQHIPRAQLIIYAPNDLLPSGSDRRIGEALTRPALHAEGVAAPSPYYLENTGALIHRMDPASAFRSSPPPGALTRDAQEQLVTDTTGISWGIGGTAFGREEFTALAAAARK
jgi:hypothetical protein